MEKNNSYFEAVFDTISEPIFLMEGQTFIDGNSSALSLFDINSELGVFNSNLQLLLILKALLALIIASGVVYSLANKVLKKTPHPIMKHFHKFVLFIGILIVIIAKFMFTV